MTRFNNVQTLLKLADTNDTTELCILIGSAMFAYDVEELAEDIAFVIISLWAMIPEGKAEDFKDKLTDDIVNYQLKIMFEGEEG